MTVSGFSRRLVELDVEECRTLLGSMTLGRLAYTEGALPAVRPVSFVLHGDEVLIPTGAGSKVAAASRGAVVAFEVDEIDAERHTGWNVTVVGPSRVITDPLEIDALDALGIRAWVGSDEPCYIAVGIARISGRRVLGQDGALGSAVPAAEAS